jgi:hypothetical protein
MREASELVLPCLPLRTEAKIVRWPDRYVDPRGEKMWRTVSSLLDAADGIGTPCTDATPGKVATPRTDAPQPLARVHTPSSLMSLISEYPSSGVML